MKGPIDTIQQDEGKSQAKLAAFEFEFSAVTLFFLVYSCGIKPRVDHDHVRVEESAAWRSHWL